MSNARNDGERNECSKFPEIRVKEGVNNYGAWAVKAKYRLLTMKLWDYIEGPSSTPLQVPMFRKTDDLPRTR
jgi:hypothetical protein